MTQLNAILALSEELHFARAARRLDISQPALSQKIQRIETEIGVTLFERSNRRVSPTRAGEALLATLPDILDRLGQGIDRARRIASGDEGHVRVGFVENASFHLVPLVITRLKQLYPAAQIDLVEMISPEMPEALASGRIDVALTRPIDTDDFRSIEALREPYAVALPETHPLARQASVPVEALGKLTFIAAAGQKANYLRRQFGPLFQRAGFQLRIGQEVNQLPAIIALVAAGIGYTIMPASATTGLAIPGVCYRPISDKAAPEAVLLVCARERDSNPLVDRIFKLAKSYSSV